MPEALKTILARHGDLPAAVVAEARAAFFERVDRDDLAACSYDRVVAGSPTSSGESTAIRVMIFTHVRVAVNVAVMPADGDGDGAVVVRGAVEPGEPVGVDLVTPRGALPSVTRDRAAFSSGRLDHGVVRVVVHLAHPPARIHTDWFRV